MRVSCILVFLVTLFTTMGCGDEMRAGKYGMISEGTPQHAALKFTKAVYKEQNLDPALALSTERFQKILAAYHTPRNVQRQVFNVRFDEVVAEVVAGGTLLSIDSRDDAEIDIKLEGRYNGERLWDLKTIMLVKEKGGWKVAGVKESVP
ncbi:MAG: hypothetical protein AAGJ37_10840 [Pseudomonadota bacterium]